MSTVWPRCRSGAVGSKPALIRSGVESKDWDRVERAAHALKGAAGNLGAVQVQAVCDHIQSACRQHRTDDLGQQAQVLAEDLARAEGALRELLDRLRQ